MGFPVRLAVDDVAAVVSMTGGIGDEPPSVIVETNGKEVRVTGATATRILAITSPAAPGTGKGRSLFAASDLTQAISDARDAGKPTLAVEMDGGHADPSGPVRKVLHVPGILHLATTGNPLIAFEIAVNDLAFMVKQAAHFAGTDGVVRLECRREQPLIMQAGSAIAAVLVDEIKPAKPPKKAKVLTHG